MINDVDIISKNEIPTVCERLKGEGYRFVALTCEKLLSNYELTYHFDLNYEMKHIRVFADFKDILASISSVFPAAFLIENEYQDLFGLTFEGLIIDYKGHLYLMEEGPAMPLA